MIFNFQLLHFIYSLRRVFTTNNTSFNFTVRSMACSNIQIKLKLNSMKFLLIVFPPNWCNSIEIFFALDNCICKTWNMFIDSLRHIPFRGFCQHDGILICNWQYRMFYTWLIINIKSSNEKHWTHWHRRHTYQNEILPLEISLIMWRKLESISWWIYWIYLNERFGNDCISMYTNTHQSIN